MKEVQTTKREFGIFAAAAFGLPLVMMLPLWMGYRAGLDTSNFATAQMFYPAAGAMLALWMGGRPDLPKRFFGLHLASTLLMAAAALLSLALPDPAGGLCVVVGSEGQGLTQETIDACTGTVRIPMTDRVESLNAGVAGSVLLWHFRGEGL